MFLLNNFKVTLNKRISYNSSKKNIFLVIRKSPGEFDFISHILNEFKKEFNIFTIFNNNFSYIHLCSNDLLKRKWQNISYGFTINSKTRYLFLRGINRLLNNGKFPNLKIKVNKKIIEKYYNFDELLGNIKDTLNLKNLHHFKKNILFCSFNNKSGWLESFKNNHQKIVLFPDRTGMEYYKKKSHKNISSNKNVLALFPNKNTYLKYSNKIEFKNYIFCSYPKFTNKWIRSLIKTKVTKKKQATIFYKSLDQSMFVENDYFNQIDELIYLLKKNNLKINFNLHPYARKELEKYLKKYKYKSCKISKNNIYQDIYESKILINIYGSNTALDCLAQKNMH